MRLSRRRPSWGASRSKPQPVVRGGPVNARLRQKSMARVTNCDSQLFQSALRGNTNSLMIAIDQTPDTNSESGRLADNLLARAFYLVETAPMSDGLGEAIQSNSSGEMARITHKLVGCSFCWGAEAFTRPLRELERLAHAGDLPGHTRCLPIFARKSRAFRAPSRNLSKHCRPPIHNR